MSPPEVRWAHHSSPSPVTPQNLPGERRHVDGGGRSRNRSSYAPPDNRHHHPTGHRLGHWPPRDGQTGLTPVSANGSRAWAQLVNMWQSSGRAEVQIQAQVQIRSQWVAHGGQLRGGRGQGEGDNRGRGRRNRDTEHSTHTPAPAPRRMFTPPVVDSPSIVPRVITSGGTGWRNVLRKNSRGRPKILFYNKNEPYYGFTNFSPHPVMYNGKRYPTSEHLFQSFKVGEKILLYFYPLVDLGMFTSSFINPT